MEQVTIDAKGHWLAPAAAASYKRMLAAGMPGGGIASAGRTFEEQKALWRAYKAGRGNLAAEPGKSLHESGRALDITRLTAAQRWAARGGKPLHATPGESIQANEYGWIRSVNGVTHNEPWHFMYVQDKDLHLGKPQAPKFPLPVGWYFGPAKPLWRVKSVSGKYRYGANLREWQAQAKDIGYDVNVTGLYDAKTAAAAWNLQKQARLATDGLIGAKTWVLPWRLV